MKCTKRFRLTPLFAKRLEEAKRGLLLAVFGCVVFCTVLFPLTSSTAQNPAQEREAKEISPSARQQIESLIAEKRHRTPAQRKLDSQLLTAIKLKRGEPMSADVPTLRIDVKTDAQGRALVDLDATVSDDLLKQIKILGGEVINSFPQFNAIRAQVPLSALETLAARADVKFIRRAIEPIMQQDKRAVSAEQERARQPDAPDTPADAEQRRANVRASLPTALRALAKKKSGVVQDLAPATGSVTSEGDKTHRADAARSSFSVNGTGVKIGVISDSVDFLSNSQASGELGTVTVLSGQSGVPGTGEGTAMLEIVHDLAPGADLFFATANGGPANFAQNILNLRAAGCDIIVDDIEYPNESPFQDSVIAQAVNSVTSGGALYFSSATNSGNLNDGTSSTWEGDFVDAGDFLFNGQSVGRLHSFGASTMNTVASGGSQRAVSFFWSDALGASANDYDVYVLDSTGTTVVNRSDDSQTGTQDPFESISTINVGEKIVLVKFSGVARFLHLEVGRGRLSIATAGRTKGHSAAVNAYSVAAVPASSSFPNPFVGGATNPVETFSSDGPRRVFYNADGSAITPGNFSSTGGTVRQKPDIAAADGVSTSVPGFNPFFGTSAAAPHAAAIAGLIKSFNPALTPTQIRTALTSTALDIEASGVDRDSGAGIVMAFQAIQSLAGTGQELSTDDGTVESGALQDNLIVVNRLTPTNYPSTLQKIRIFFTQFQGLPSPAGAQIRLIVFAGAAGTTQPSNNPTLLVNQTVTIPSLPNGGGFIDYTIQNGPTINGGDFYVGFQAPNPAGGVVFAADTNGTQRQRGFFSTNNGSTYQGPLVLVDQQGTQTPANIMIRATVATGIASSLRIDTVSPPARRTSGGQQLTLIGAFTGLASAKLGGVAASIVSSSATQLVLTTPAHAVGAVNVDLIPTSGGAYTKTNAFAYLPTVFTDDTLVVGVTKAKAQHIIELRQAVDALRVVAGLQAAQWTDATLMPNSTKIKAAHITELRARLEEAAVALGFTQMNYTDPNLGVGSVIKRIHIEELRQRIRNIVG
jgi:Subtilase family/IPT/TIG domain